MGDGGMYVVYNIQHLLCLEMDGVCDFDAFMLVENDY